MRLMTNNPKKIKGLEGYNLSVVERVPIEIGHKAENDKYLRTKKRKMGMALIAKFIKYRSVKIYGKNNRR